jgi:hypothetical protein
VPSLQRAVAPLGGFFVVSTLLAFAGEGGVLVAEFVFAGLLTAVLAFIIFDIELLGMLLTEFDIVLEFIIGVFAFLFAVALFAFEAVPPQALNNAETTIRAVDNNKVFFIIPSLRTISFCSPSVKDRRF